MEQKVEGLAEFIETTITSIEKGMPKGYSICSIIKFDFAVATTKETKGGFKFFVVDANGKYNKETTSRIKFNIEKKHPSGF